MNNQYQNANYQPHELPMLNGNPLTEAIRGPIPARSLAEKLTYCPFNSGINAIDLDDFSRKMVIEDIRNNFLPHPEMPSIYNAILQMILLGYAHRNPLDRDTTRMQYRIATDKDFKVTQLNKLAQCIAMIGLSGMGKTLTIEMCLSLLPQVIRHQEYQGNALRLDQIVWLSMEAPSTKTKKGFILNFFEAVDNTIGTTYFEDYKKSKESVSSLLSEAKKVAFNHYIGVVFIDEIQRSVSSNADTDKSSLEFIDSFFNAIGIPFICAGTYAARPLFRNSLSTGRRLSSGRFFSFDRFEANNPFWPMLVKSFYFPGLLHKDFEFDNNIINFLHDRSAGLPDILSRLLKRSYETAIDSGEERITGELISDVYRTEFKIINPALEALRSGKVGHYEDLINFDHLDASISNPLETFMAKHCSTSQPAPDEDLGIHIELPAEKKQTLITNDDLRNNAGLSKVELQEALVNRRGTSC